MKRYTAKYWFMHHDEKDCMELTTDSLQEAIDFVTYIPSCYTSYAFARHIYDNARSGTPADQDVWTGATATETELKRTVALLCAGLDSVGDSVKRHVEKSVENTKEMVAMLRPVACNPATADFD